MKSPLKKLRSLALGLHKHDHHKQQQQPKLDELSQASQDMQDMKDCYDSLLSSAAATANSAYEFSESLREMGDCLLEKTSLNDDEDSGRVLLMLGKVQFDIQKLLDNYRSHISRTVTVPSESLLNELRIVEDMKRQCDEKRILYDEMKIRHKQRKRLGSKKGEYVSSNQVRVAQEEFEEDATLFVFRMKSLKGGQSRSLLTQAARHHAAQVCFFKKALKSLETIEPYVQLVTQQNHIDYQFSGLEDDDRDSVFLTTDDEDETDDDDDDCENGELSFDYQRNCPKNQVSSSENSMELDSAELTFPQVAPLNSVKRKPLWNSSTFNIKVNAGSKSAPLSADPGEKFRQMRQSSARKLNTYVLPTPKSNTQPASKTTNNMWHSSPLERKPKFSGPINNKPAPLPSPVKPVFERRSSFTAKNVKRYAFSGPIPGSVYSKNSLLSTSGPIHQFSGSPLGNSPPISTKLYSFSGSFVSSPKISELHELPRPPPNLSSNKPPLKAGFSAPLVSFKDFNITNKPTFSNAASTLPVPSESQNLKATVSPPHTPVSFRNSSLNNR